MVKSARKAYVKNSPVDLSRGEPGARAPGIVMPDQAQFESGYMSQQQREEIARDAAAAAGSHGHVPRIHKGHHGHVVHHRSSKIKPPAVAHNFYTSRPAGTYF